jgi:hypothetical protein
MQVLRKSSVQTALFQLSSGNTAVAAIEDYTRFLPDTSS